LERAARLACFRVLVEIKAWNFSTAPHPNRHQRRHVAPQVEAAVIPRRAPYPLLRAADILDHHRDVMARGFRRLSLDAEAGLEQRVIRRWQRFRPFPRHRAVTVGLARRRSHDTGGCLELRAVHRQHVLKHELRGIRAVLDIEAHHVIAVGEKSFGPAP